jgi:hypothetical protein
MDTSGGFSNNSLSSRKVRNILTSRLDINFSRTLFRGESRSRSWALNHFGIFFLGSFIGLHLLALSDIRFKWFCGL